MILRGIELISLNPDTMIKTRLAVAEVEKELKKWATRKANKKVRKE